MIGSGESWKHRQGHEGEVYREHRKDPLFLAVDGRSRHEVTEDHQGVEDEEQKNAEAEKDHLRILDDGMAVVRPNRSLADVESHDHRKRGRSNRKDLDQAATIGKDCEQHCWQGPVQRGQDAVPTEESHQPAKKHGDHFGDPGDVSLDLCETAKV